MGAFALVAAYFLWQSKGIGGVIGIMYAVIEMLWSLSSLGLYPLGIQYTLLDLVFDMGFDTILIILIVIGRKSLRYE
jgi:hypothetical protein